MAEIFQQEEEIMAGFQDKTLQLEVQIGETVVDVRPIQNVRFYFDDFPRLVTPHVIQFNLSFLKDVASLNAQVGFLGSTTPWSFGSEPIFLRLKDVNDQVPDIVRVTTVGFGGILGAAEFSDISRIRFSNNEIEFDLTNRTSANPLDALEFSPSAYLQWDVDFAPELQQDLLPELQPGVSSITILPSQLLSNDTDTDTDDNGYELDPEVLTVTAVDPVIGGSVSFDNNNNIVFNLDANFTGNAQFRYTVSDGNGGEASTTATIPIPVPQVIDGNLIIASPTNLALQIENLTLPPNTNVTIDNNTNVTFEKIYISSDSLVLNLGDISSPFPEGIIIENGGGLLNKGNYTVTSDFVQATPVVDNSGVIYNGPLSFWNFLAQGTELNANNLTQVKETQAVAGSSLTAQAVAIESSYNAQIDNSGLFLNDGVIEGFSFNLQENGVLAGSGTFNGGTFVINDATTLAPGGTLDEDALEFNDSNGTFTISNDLSLAENGTIAFSISGTDEGEFDQVAVGGNASLNSGSLSFEIEEAGLTADIAPAETKVIELINAAQVANNLDLEALTPTPSAEFNYNLVADNNSLNLEITRPASDNIVFSGNDPNAWVEQGAILGASIGGGPINIFNSAAETEIYQVVDGNSAANLDGNTSAVRKQINKLQIDDTGVEDPVLSGIGVGTSDGAQTNQGRASNGEIQSDVGIGAADQLFIDFNQPTQEIQVELDLFFANEKVAWEPGVAAEQMRIQLLDQVALGAGELTIGGRDYNIVAFDDLGTYDRPQSPAPDRDGGDGDWSVKTASGTGRWTGSNVGEEYFTIETTVPFDAIILSGYDYSVPTPAEFNNNNVDVSDYLLSSIELTPFIPQF